MTPPVAAQHHTNGLSAAPGGGVATGPTAAWIGPKEKEILKSAKRKLKELAMAVATTPPSAPNSAASSHHSHYGSGTTNPTLQTLSSDEQHEQVQAHLRPLVAEYATAAAAVPGDILAALGLYMVPRERDAAVAVLAAVVHRGPHPVATEANAYVFAVAALIATTLLGEDKCWKAASVVLTTAWTHITNCTVLQDRRREDRHARLFDVFLVLLARHALFEANDPERALRHLSHMTAHKLVLDEQTYAVVALLKALAQLDAGNATEVLATLQRRMYQEAALHELGTVRSALEVRGSSVLKGPGGGGATRRQSTVVSHTSALPVDPAQARRASVAAPPSSAAAVHADTVLDVIADGSPRIGAGGQVFPVAPAVSPAAAASVHGHPVSTVSRGSATTLAQRLDRVPRTVVHLCHDLMLYVCAVKLRETMLADAERVFAEYAADYPRGASLEAFTREYLVPGKAVANARTFLRGWTLDALHLSVFTRDVNVVGATP
ncbi:hypothetical protein AMAG_08999 [Allomyces macrogynus ATCC 38327]|uniref:Uncharacterized protein n=1 Tax=Allomyces macrogynus (strain ATCC 38327) TaxID=578462 RepID=A0A0L0SN18_ALLM3|nr:hypothetical protein AMAG_08999 [Allomyces macrogynus ATCC 38327]|eukprot:KNE63936.1 hypothetical protein AMAG_08999 [Allomyces macrogynus ATCC 38327]